MEVKEALIKVRENWLRKVRVDGKGPIYEDEYLAGMFTAIMEMEDYLGLDLDEEEEI